MCNYWIQICERCFTPRRGGLSTPDKERSDGTCHQKVVTEHHGLFPTLYWHERNKRSRRLESAVWNEQATDRSKLRVRIWLTPGCLRCLGHGRKTYTQEEKMDTVLNAAELDAGTPEEEAQMNDGSFAYLQARRVMVMVLSAYPAFQDVLPKEFYKWRIWKKQNPDPVLEKFQAWIMKEDEPKPVAKPELLRLFGSTPGQRQGLRVPGRAALDKLPILTYPESPPARPQAPGPSGSTFSRPLMAKPAGFTPANQPRTLSPPGDTLDLPSGSKDRAAFNDPFAFMVGSWDDYALSEDGRSLSLEYESGSSVPSEVMYYDPERRMEQADKSEESTIEVEEL